MTPDAPYDERLIEHLCRAVCVADGVDPDAMGTGLGRIMPKEEVYPLWKSRRSIVLAVMESLGKWEAGT